MEKPKNKNSFINRMGIMLSLAGAVALSFSAFNKWTRVEIGRRDKWTCQETGKQFRDGWMLQAAHYPDCHKDGWDDNPDNGRMLCTESHIREEIRRGNLHGARLLHKSQTVRTYEWIAKQAGVDVGDLSANIINQFDEKKPFGYYLETSDATFTEG